MSLHFILTFAKITFIYNLGNAVLYFCNYLHIKKYNFSMHLKKINDFKAQTFSFSYIEFLHFFSAIIKSVTYASSFKKLG